MIIKQDQNVILFTVQSQFQMTGIPFSRTVGQGGRPLQGAMSTSEGHLWPGAFGPCTIDLFRTLLLIPHVALQGSNAPHSDTTQPEKDNFRSPSWDCVEYSASFLTMEQLVNTPKQRKRTTPREIEERVALLMESERSFPMAMGAVYNDAKNAFIMIN